MVHPGERYKCIPFYIDSPLRGKICTVKEVYSESDLVRVSIPGESKDFLLSELELCEAKTLSLCETEAKEAEWPEK